MLRKISITWHEPRYIFISEAVGIGGRRFGSWEQADDPDRVFRKKKIVDEFGKEKVVTVDLAESFFAELGDW